MLPIVSLVFAINKSNQQNIWGQKSSKKIIYSAKEIMKVWQKGFTITVLKIVQIDIHACSFEFALGNISFVAESGQ